MNDSYRQAASMLLLRPSGTSYDFLLLHKPRKRDAWQLPQGGMEQGETLEECALRELEEEAGINNAEVIGHSELIYQYDFPTSYRRFRPDNICGQRILFVFAFVTSDTEVRVDGKEVDRYEWVKPADVGRFIKRGEYLDLVKKLYDEALSNMIRS